MLQLTADKRTRQYELTFLVPVALTSTEATQVDESIATLLKKHNFTIVSKEDWGKKDLAYPIKQAGTRHTQAAYRHWLLEGDAAHAQPFEQDLYLQQTILRHLLVLAEAAQPEQTSAKLETE